MRGKGGKKKVSSRRTKTFRAGLSFSVGRIERKLRNYYGKKFRICASMPVFVAAIIEYLNAEVLELAGYCCKDMKKKLITPRHILLAIANDYELHELLKNVTIRAGGVRPYIHKCLIRPSKVALTGAKTIIPTSNWNVSGPKSSAKKPKPKASPAPAPAQVPAPGPPFNLKKATTLLKKQKSVKRKDNSGIVTLREKRLGGGQRLSIVTGDILDVKADALINPTNDRLYMGGQVGSAISKSGGPTLKKVMSDLRKSHGKLDRTEAVISNFNDEKCIIHCHGPTWSGSGDDVADNLRATIFSCLRVAEENNIKSIAFPSVGSGKAGIPKQMAAETIIAAINEYFGSNEDSGIEDIYFVLFDEESQACYLYEIGRL